jgi:hypothetical protein
VWRPAIPRDRPKPRKGPLTDRASTLSRMSDPLIELQERLEEAAAELRSGQLEPEAALALIEECARMAGQAAAQVDERSRAALEPLPDLPGQLPLAAG